jgi:hypothetical protein
MKTMMTRCLAFLVPLAVAGPVLAHHSLANYDITKALRVKGTIVQVHEINPHVFILMDGLAAGATARRWAVEGPSILGLKRKGLANDALKTGAAIEVCGYLPKEPIVWQFASREPNAVSVSGRLINGEVLVTADGHEHVWSDYGGHKCFAPGYSDQHPPQPPN